MVIKVVEKWSTFWPVFCPVLTGERWRPKLSFIPLLWTPKILRKSPFSRFFRVFSSRTLGQTAGRWQFWQFGISEWPRVGILTRIIGYLWSKNLQNREFRVYKPNHCFGTNRCFKASFDRSNPKLSTIQDKSDVTPNFITGRDWYWYFQLGPVLLRSARSMLDGSALFLVIELTDAVTINPLTTVTSDR